MTVESGRPAATAGYLEPAREVPVIERTDVVVCGAGPAGIAAALAAARTGARTRLIEVLGCLGGTWTAGQLAWIWDFDKPGIAREITDALTRSGARVGTNRHHFAYDIEALKLLLDQLCLEAGVQVQLFTRVVGAVRDADNRLSLIITESKSGRQAWAAEAFVDTTGDGDLAALAGCGFDVGHPETGQVQPMTYMALINVRDAAALREFISFWQGNERHTPAVFLAEIRRAGREPSYGHPTLFQVHENLLALMINHEYGVSALDAAAVTGATLRGRAEVHAIVEALRGLGGPWEGVHVVATSEHIGIREARRIHGRYRVTREDLVSGARHIDAICRVTFGVDVHSLDPSRDRGLSAMGVVTLPYDIPLRALIARDVDGLLMAGRCISGDFLAHASYRVTGNAVAMGQAAGTVAALGALAGQAPHEVPWDATRAALEAQGWAPQD